MKWKVGAAAVLFLAGALLSRTINVESPSDRAEATPKAAVSTQPAPAMVDGLRTFEVVQPPARESRRNLFAFTEAPPRPQRQVVQTVTPKSIEAPQIVQIAQKPEVPTPREPEFPMRFIGTFGEAKDLIAVFEANGDIVNAKIGDRVTGEFKLASIGIESVEVSSSRGATQRVELRR